MLYLPDLCRVTAPTSVPGPLLLLEIRDSSTFPSHLPYLASGVADQCDLPRYDRPSSSVLVHHDFGLRYAYSLLYLCILLITVPIDIASRYEYSPCPP